MNRTNLSISQLGKLVTYYFPLILLLLFIGPIFQSVSSLNLINDDNTIQKNTELVNFNPNKELLLDLKIEEQSQIPDRELFFPTFLYYSIEVANLLIENLYDDNSDIFYFSCDEEWQNSSIAIEKRTFDNAHSILALLKLADAVLNQTQRDFAIDVATKTGDGIISNLWDPIFGGFYISEPDRYKKPGVQGQAIQAFTALYEATGNSIYRDMALDTFTFVDSTAWNITDNYYVYVTSHSGLPLFESPHSGDQYGPQSLRVDHNAIMGSALLDLYRMESNDSYLTKALEIFDKINSTCRNTSTNVFYTGMNTQQEIVSPYASDIFINSLVLEFLADLYNVTEDIKYYDEFFLILNSVLIRFWDNDNGGFIATSSLVNSSFDDKSKYTERQFYGIRVLDEAYKLTDDHLYYNLILDTVEILNDKLYDQVNGGYYQLSFPDGSQSPDASWRRKSAVTQSLAIYSLANLWLYDKPGALNVIWSPSTPGPQDDVTLLIAAFDSEGISSVFLNYSIDGSPFELLEMIPHSVGNMYNVTLPPPPSGDGTTILFNIIINNTLNAQVIRGQYSFLWQADRWPPDILVLGLLPGLEIPANEEFSVFVSAQDVPIQGIVDLIRIHYGLIGKSSQSVQLNQTAEHIWVANFPDGLPTPGIYEYYFESWDYHLNVGFSHKEHFRILSQPKPPDASFLIGFLVVMGIFVPAGLYTYVEYTKKSARKQLKSKQKIRYKQRGRKLSKRGRKRT